MRRLGTIIVLALAATGCDQTTFEPGAELPLAYAAVYRSSGGGGLFFQHDVEAEDDPTALFEIPNFVPASAGQPALSELLGYPLTDCSDRDYRCIQIGLHAVLAVPRQGVAPGAAFDFAGAQFHVTCDNATCKSALIRSECAFWERTEEGEPLRCVGKEAGNVSAGHAVTYLFERDRGVVVFEANAACKPPFSLSACADEDALVLQNGIGLLGPES